MRLAMGLIGEKMNFFPAVCTCVWSGVAPNGSERRTEKTKGKTMRKIMRKLVKSKAAKALAVGAAILASSTVVKADPPAIPTITTITGLVSDASTGYAAAAALGVSILGVGFAVLVVRKGIRLKG